MLATRHESTSQKKGLSVSLSKNHKFSDSKQVKIQPIPLKEQHWRIYHPIPIVTNTKTIKRPVVIYKQTKTEWDRLQQTNKNKREVVQKMKAQLQNINKQEILLSQTVSPHHISNLNSNRELKNSPYNGIGSNYFQQKIDNSKIFLNTTRINNFDAISTPYKLNSKRLSFPQILQKDQNQQEQFKIKITQPIDKLKISNLAQGRKCSLNVDYQNNENIQLLKLPLKNQNKKVGYGNKKMVTIDVGVLQQIESKLNNLIDYTKF